MIIMLTVKNMMMVGDAAVDDQCDDVDDNDDDGDKDDNKHDDTSNDDALGEAVAIHVSKGLRAAVFPHEGLTPARSRSGFRWL